MQGVFGFMERKWNKRKLRKPIDELGHSSPSSLIDFRNFLFFHFLSIKPNGPVES
jgi:hypothetical protein